jgi:hypothetical protein
MAGLLLCASRARFSNVERKLVVSNNSIDAPRAGASPSYGEEVADMCVRRSLAVITIVLGMAGVGHSQVFRSSTDLVNVTATVVDKNGDPIRGLTKADFTILEDGKPQDITFFRQPRSFGATKSSWFMAALTEATVIVEAGETSGTLHQAADCVRLGRFRSP